MPGSSTTFSSRRGSKHTFGVPSSHGASAAGMQQHVRVGKAAVFSLESRLAKLKLRNSKNEDDSAMSAEKRMAAVRPTASRALGPIRMKRRRRPFSAGNAHRSAGKPSILARKIKSADAAFAPPKETLAEAMHEEAARRKTGHRHTKSHAVDNKMVGTHSRNRSEEFANDVFELLASAPASPRKSSDSVGVSLPPLASRPKVVVDLRGSLNVRSSLVSCDGYRDHSSESSDSDASSDDGSLSEDEYDGHTREGSWRWRMDDIAAEAMASAGAGESRSHGPSAGHSRHSSVDCPKPTIDAAFVDDILAQSLDGSLSLDASPHNYKRMAMRGTPGDIASPGVSPLNDSPLVFGGFVPASPAGFERAARRLAAGGSRASSPAPLPAIFGSSTIAAF